MCQRLIAVCSCGSVIPSVAGSTGPVTVTVIPESTITTYCRSEQSAAWGKVDAVRALGPVRLPLPPARRPDRVARGRRLAGVRVANRRRAQLGRLARQECRILDGGRSPGV